MRRIVPVLLLAMMGATTALVVTHQQAGAPVAEAAPVPVAAPIVAPAPPPPLARTLRTVALGWELATPGVIANTGGTTSAYKLVGLDAAFAAVNTAAELEAALAQGGAQASGADLAIMPLSTYVASYERLRALAPEIVFVVGYSRGREAIHGSLTKLPATGRLALAAPPASPEAFLALFLLDLAGVAPSRVDVSATDTRAPLRARAGRGTGKLLVTSADLPHAMPIVAVAPRGFITSHATELEAWGRVWLGGAARLAEDVPAGGRLVAAQTGAPPVLSVIETLGQLEFASLRDNAAAMGLSGRGALTLDELFRTTWRIWRDQGVLTTPAPEVTPLSPALVAALVRTATPDAAVRPRAPVDTQRPEVLLVVRGPQAKAGKLDAEAFVNQLGMLAGVFDRLRLRIAIRGDAKTAVLLADMARERFGLRPEQLLVGKQPAAGNASIEVLAPD